MAAKVPKLRDNPVAFYSLMDHLKIPREISEAGLIQTHYPSLKEYLTNLATEGKPLPAGIGPNDTYAVYSVLLRTRFDLDEVIEGLEDVNEKGIADTSEERRAKCVEYIKKVSAKIV